MHGILSPFATWLTREKTPPMALAAIYSILLALSTQIEVERCKCYFHPVTNLGEFYVKYTVALLGSWAVFWVLSRFLRTRAMQIAAVACFTIVGISWVKPVLDSATHSYTFDTEFSNDVVFD